MIKRAAIEGLRIWISQPYFKENPGIAIKLISSQKSDDSASLRKSVGDVLRDIVRKNSDLVKNEIATWDLADEKTRFTHEYVIKNDKTRFTDADGTL